MSSPSHPATHPRDARPPADAPPSRWAGRLTGSRPVAALALVFALGILAGTVMFGTLHLRRHLREHLVERDGDILYTVALARQYANGAGTNLTRRIGDPAEQLALALDISQLNEGVLGVRLFDPEGRFVTALPLTLHPARLSMDDLAVLRRIRPVSRFLDRADLADYFWLPAAEDSAKAVTPLLEVNIPIHARGSSNLLAAAQLLLDGHPIAREYARVDEHLWWLAAALFVGGAALLSGVLAWAYHRLRRAHALLEVRTAHLLRANHELALAAKTSALGAVTAHLIHGLSNPLANLQDLISSHGDNGVPEQDWKDAATAARRMQQLVHDVVRVLGEERGNDHYELTLAELVGVLKSKLQPTADSLGVRLGTELNADGRLSNRHANLVLLILENLIHNGLKVTPRNRAVRLIIHRTDDGVRCEVEDQGPGIAPGLVSRLFTPCRSTHGGSGLGLAISRQLALQLGARLELNVSSPTGSVFVLTLPPTLLVGPGEADARPAPRDSDRTETLETR